MEHEDMGFCQTFLETVHELGFEVLLNEKNEVCLEHEEYGALSFDLFVQLVLSSAEHHEEADRDLFFRTVKAFATSFPDASKQSTQRPLKGLRNRTRRKNNAT